MRALRLLLVASVAACGSFGTTSQPGDGGSPPKANDAGVAAPGDGSTELDGGVPVDCMKRSAFSDGFERENGQLASGWDAFQQQGGTLAIDKILPLRGLASVKVDLQTTEDGYARLKKTVPPGGTCPLRVSFLFKAKGFPTGGDAAVLQVDYGIGELELILRADQTFEISDDLNGGGSTHEPIPVPLSIDEIVDVLLVFDPKMTRVTYSMKRGDSPAVTGSVPTVSPYDKPVQVIFGADNVETTKPFAYFVDEIVID